MPSLISHPVAGKQEGLKGTARIHGDKAISHRALILTALAGGKSTITGLLEGPDVLHTAKALIALGVPVAPPADRGGTWHIDGIGTPAANGGLKTPRTVLYLGNSATAARLLMGVIGSHPLTATLMGDDSLSRRPMGRVVKPLAQMGVRFETGTGDLLPLRISGTAQPRAIHYEMNSISTQVKSAVLIAALRASGQTVITEPLQTRDHTERLLRHMGAAIRNDIGGDGKNVVTINGPVMLQAQNITIPADPSSAAFLAVAATVTPESDIIIPHVCINPLRTGLFTTLIDMGADIAFENRRDVSGEPVADIRVKTAPLRAIRVPDERCFSMADEFPALCAAAAFAEGTTIFRGAAELHDRQTDHIAMMARGLLAAGVAVETYPDGIAVTGTGTPPRGGCRIDAARDHRVALAFLSMGIATRERIEVDGTDTINTHFPAFARLMNDLGGWISDGGIEKTDDTEN